MDGVIDLCSSQLLGVIPVSNGARREQATVIARWDAHRALLRTAAGLAFPVQVPPELQDRLDVEAAAWVKLDGADQVVEWGLED
jgi:hypothetical protein